MNKLFLGLLLGLTLVACNAPSEAPKEEKTVEQLVDEVVARDWVVDRANLLTSAQFSSLRRKISNFSRSDVKKPQIVILTVNSLEGQSIEQFANSYFRKIKIGNAEFNNGALIVIAKNDRKLRIEVGYGLEGNIPDLVAGDIIDKQMKPNLKKGSENWFKAVDSAVDEIIKLAKKD